MVEVSKLNMETESLCMLIWRDGGSLVGNKKKRTENLYYFKCEILDSPMANCWSDSLMALEISLFEYITKIFTALTVGKETRVNYTEVKFVLKINHKAVSAHSLKLLTILI